MSHNKHPAYKWPWPKVRLTILERDQRTTTSAQLASHMTPHTVKSAGIAAFVGVVVAHAFRQ
jgi:hypothetical protein